MDKLFENNQATVAGKISKVPEFSHEIYGEKFYITYIKSARESGYEDEIPVIVSERLHDANDLNVGQMVATYGQFRSFNKHEENRSRLILQLFAREIEVLDDMQTGRDENMISLDGFICKNPVYRKTPLGREISDFLLAVNRTYGKTDYIPCLAWGRNARYVSGLEVGSRVKICGRIQSREYQKCISDTETETRVAYEVSVSKVEVVDETDC